MPIVTKPVRVLTYCKEFPPIKSYGTKYSRMDQVKFFKGCLPQVSLGPFWNTWTHMTFLLRGLLIFMFSYSTCSLETETPKSSLTSCFFFFSYSFVSVFLSGVTKGFDICFGDCYPGHV